MSALHVYTNDTDTFVAASMQHAVEVAREYWTELGLTEDEMDFDFHQRPDAKRLKVWEEEGPEGERMQTCAEWASENGEGFLCSTEF